MTACENGAYFHKNDAACARKQMLVAGALTDEWFDLLIDISPIHSPKAINALRDHLVGGDSRKAVCERYGVNAGYLSTCMGRLFHTNQLVGQLAFYYRGDK
ncbi:transcriptional regulator [Edwardsiella piscicida]|uniref:PapB/FocB family fimbrial expression transcriptional regulator n=1 Tax=Edwardsiella piscicida TaxID=1263550 RepID=UPI00054CB9FD|nr:PapB/FocB family fimbrial expression transcriptional regulator [Edwardsiella piscicida]EKS7794821.1 transcriptional regulator [Edwardsiella piscicida]ELM3659875.1 transcriptional regulator [Edwardsiella piscicida]ELM3724037.1 transcriptional regulator [Edwardsiella piscicida]ELM3729769.1 transcriptional regulator [Edwardsiella piscicida]ELV7537218.1 transcriptional regulator [Edwardsiella piscicida]